MQLWWWGVLVLALGLATALFGVVFAAVQTDMKRLLAYSSIENIGLIFAGIGLTLILFTAYGMRALAALALTAALYHALNHAFFKSLLFLGTGSVLHATRERNLGKLGGLIHRMPWVAWLALVGALAIAGLPPLNGFVSEWLLLQASCSRRACRSRSQHAGAGGRRGAGAGRRAGRLRDGQVLRRRSSSASRARRTSRTPHDAGTLERVGLVWLAAGCVLLGLFPVRSSRCSTRSTQHAASARRPGASGGRQLAAARADQRRPRELQPADRSCCASSPSCC